MATPPTVTLSEEQIGEVVSRLAKEIGAKFTPTPAGTLEETERGE